jgi:hypothetical protein
MSQKNGKENKGGACVAQSKIPDGNDSFRGASKIFSFFPHTQNFFELYNTSKEETNLKVSFNQNICHAITSRIRTRK